MNTNEILTSVFVENGINFLPADPDSDIIMDSIEFVSVIVTLESEFNVEIPDEYLLMEKLRTFSQFHNMIESLLYKEGGERDECGN